MSSLDALRSELQPILGDATASVISRLAVILDFAADLGVSTSSQPSDSEQAERLLARLKQFQDELTSTDLPLQSRLIGTADVVLFLEFRHRFEQAVRGIQSQAVGRPRDEVRRIVLNDVVFALEASGVRCPKTRGGILEQTARVVLRAIGDTQLPVDMGRLIFEAVDRYQAGVISETDSPPT